MRGWEYVGQIAEHGLQWDELAFDDRGMRAAVRKGDIIAVSSRKDGELRFGTFQVAMAGEDILVARGSAGVKGNIPSIADFDHVYRAVAMGASVFTRAE